MHNIVVTLKTNLDLNDEGEIQYDAEGEILLINDNDVGIIAKTHVIPLSQVDEKGNILAGFISRCEVYWDERRSPAPDMVEPTDLVWLSIVGDEDEPDSDELDSEDEAEEIQDAEFEEAG